jgi:hypothetical protein
MHEHGPNCLGGPLRGSPAWWRGMATREPVETSAQDRAKKRPKKDGSGGIRRELVERVRREIEAGTYDTPEKWDAALDSLLERRNTD